MANDWHKRLAKLQRLDPHNVDVNKWQSLGIDPMGYYRVTIEDGDTYESIISNFVKAYNLDPSLIRTHINDIPFRFDYHGHGADYNVETVAAHFEIQLNAIELRQLLDRAIGECERTIKREEARAAKGPSKKQIREQERQQKVAAALAKLSPAERKILGIKR